MNKLNWILLMLYIKLSFFLTFLLITKLDILGSGMKMSSNMFKNVCLGKDCLVFQHLFRWYKGGKRFLFRRPRFEPRSARIKSSFMNILKCNRIYRLEFVMYKCGRYRMEGQINLRTIDLSHSNDKSFISHVFAHSTTKSQATYRNTSQD